MHDSVALAPHPAADPAVFVCRFPRSLAELDTPPAVTDLLSLDAAVPVTADDAVRARVRDLLRVGGFRPSGRSKPSSEYLRAAAGRGAMPTINLAVDLANAVSLHSGLPLSVIDLERTTSPLRIELAASGTAYVFNAAGQSIDVGSLLCLHDATGPCANAVKDAQRTKTDGHTRCTLTVIWGTRALDGHTQATANWYAHLLTSLDVPHESLAITTA